MISVILYALMPVSLFCIDNVSSVNYIVVSQARLQFRFIVNLISFSYAMFLEE